MPMRGGARAAFSITPREFAWDRAVAATLCHSTLPWNESVAATPLTGATLGARDRLSVLAQFAAHQAALRFAGIADGDLDPSHYAIVTQRGSDVRLVRRSAEAVDADVAPPLLTLASQFAAAIRAPELDVFRQSWARAEAVFLECWFRLRAGPAADLRWIRRSSIAAIIEPGAEGLRRLGPGRHTYAGGECVRALRAFGRQVFVLRGGSVLRYEALAELRPILGDITALSEPQVAERIVESCVPAVIVVDDAPSFDPGSRRVLQMISSAGVLTVLMRDGTAPSLSETRRFIIAPSLASAGAAAAVDPETLVEGEALDEFFRRGVVPRTSDTSVEEPARSYLAVIALLGEKCPVAAAAAVLRELTTDLELDDLVVAGVSELSGDTFRILRSAELAATIPPASKAALCRMVAKVASSLGDVRRSAELLSEAGDFEAACAMFRQVRWAATEETIESLSSVPAAALDGGLRSVLAGALIESGRYRDARETAGDLPDRDREIVLARIDRRTGDYAVALARLERMQRSPESDLLRAEILLVLRRDEEAKSLLASSKAEGDRAAFLRRLAGNGQRLELSYYYAARAEGYDAIDDGDLVRALDANERAISYAASLADRIDARLDLVNTLFHSGRWQEAREAALTALGEVEETQGDRAAGGLLFLLAFLYADEGRWTLSSQRIVRLRHFYGATRDSRHLDELDLLAAHLDFSRGRFAAARRGAESVLGRANDRPIAEAAALIVDEIDWVRGRAVEERPLPRNVELARRHLMIRGGPLPQSPAPPQSFRLALARGDRAAAEAIAAAHGIELEIGQRPADVELHILRALASSLEFPMPAHALDAGWRFATRNRLGLWNQSGSMGEAPNDLLDEMLADPAGDWIRCSAHEIVEIEGAGGWQVTVRETIGAAFARRAELARLRRLHEQQEDSASTAGALAAGIIGNSPSIRDAIGRLTKVARSDVSVCILGESGTGKELGARALHAASARRQKPFVAVNCAALPEMLIESELFGHVRGAFTGADRDRVGLVDAASGGTLFLDEIGEMPLVAQAKLLRLLQEGEFRRVGEAATRAADVRVVVATNRALDAAVEQGLFREDLYYRIRGIDVVMPPLRDRGDDILLLAKHFLAQDRQKHRGGPMRLSDEVERVFLAYAWPGNVRELQNTVRAAHAMSGENPEIGIDHLPDRMRQPVQRAISGSYQDAVIRFRRELIENALAESGGNQNRAASRLRISRQALGYQIRELGILTRKTRL